MKDIAGKYKQTEVGKIPNDWEVQTIAQMQPYITSGSRGWAEYYSDFGDLFFRITNMKRGDIELDLSDCKYVSLPANEKEGKRTYLLNGDVLISITADIGIVSFVNSMVPKPAYINQHIALVRINDSNVNPQFVAYYLNHRSGQLQFQSLADNGAKAGMSLLRVEKLKIPIPPTLTEQTTIANALSDMDALISSLEKLIAKKRLIKQGAMQQLLKPRDGWVKRKLGEILKYEQPTKYLVSSTEYNDNNLIPVLTAGKSFILGYTDEEYGIFKDLPVIIFDDFTTASKYVDFPFKCKSSAMKMLKNRNNSINLRFTYEIMQQIEFPVADHKRHWIGDFQEIEIDLPASIEEQNQIAKIFDNIQNEIDNLEQKLDKCLKIKQGMMQNLLTGKIRLL
jgi:type I restriction enzyme S subunit